ncbi:MAG: hypothetical protein ABI852_14210 [Gemmatimonadaceae bacterium]
MFHESPSVHDVTHCNLHNYRNDNTLQTIEVLKQGGTPFALYVRHQPMR